MWPPSHFRERATFLYSSSHFLPPPPVVIPRGEPFSFPSFVHGRFSSPPHFLVCPLVIASLMLPTPSLPPCPESNRSFLCELPLLLTLNRTEGTSTPFPPFSIPPRFLLRRFLFPQRFSSAPVSTYSPPPSPPFFFKGGGGGDNLKYLPSSPLLPLPHTQAPAVERVER